MSPCPDPAWTPGGKPQRQYGNAAAAKLPRFGVLPLARHGRRARYVIYDRQTQRITNGVYFLLADALGNAASAEAYGANVADMTPYAEALGLLFPAPHARRGAAV